MFVLSCFVVFIICIYVCVALCIFFFVGGGGGGLVVTLFAYISDISSNMLYTYT